MKYGTAGFRDNAEKIIDISFKIGRIISYLAISKNHNFGIMITASHNEYQDNGLKIVNLDGQMINKNYESIIENYINDKEEIGDYNEILSPKKIMIGCDSRQSCDRIKSEIIRGVHSISKNIGVIDYGKVTTPQHHYLVSINSNDHNDYIEKFKEFKVLNINTSNVMIDCANGIGYWPLFNLKYIYNLNYEIINIDVNKYPLLNNDCGSDYVISNNQTPNYFKNNYLGCSLDGDADRFIFYYVDNKLNLLDGDYISLLYLLFIKNKIINKYKNKFSIGYVHTPYTNKAVIEWVKKLDNNINIICTATGVKNLHHEALKYDISVYFESNGHGTILINNKELNNEKNIKKLNIINNSVVGDGISGIFCILYFLKELNLNYKEWFNLIKKNSNILYKKNVPDKSIYNTNNVGDRLIEPKETQKKLDELMKKYNCYTFIRPSGTENVLRIYIESNENLYDVKKEIDDYL